MPGGTEVRTGRAPLRERKKRRTREALIGSALEMFTGSGFDGTTLDDLCDDAEVSKRTFFRYFTSKEDVAMAPVQDFWDAFLDEIGTRQATAGPLSGTVQAAVLAALDRMAGDDWAQRVRLSCLLATRTPSLIAHGLGVCDRTIASAASILADGPGAGDTLGLRRRLVLEFTAVAFRCALQTWASLPGEPGRQRLRTELQATFAAMPDALTVGAATSHEVD